MALTMPLPSAQTPAAHAPGASVAQRAKIAFLRLAQQRLEPTPENYAMAYRGEAIELHPAATATGAAAPAATDKSIDGRALAALIERLMRGMDRGSRQWTLARKKDSLNRVLDGGGADAARVQHRLSQLLWRWETDAPDEPVETDMPAGAQGEGGKPSPRGSGPLAAPGSTTLSAAPTNGTPLQAVTLPAEPADAAPTQAWERAVAELVKALNEALALAEPSGKQAAEQLELSARRVLQQGATPALVDDLAAQCENARRQVQHRHHLVEQLSGLCRELAASLAELAEDDSWAKGQCQAMRATLDNGITARAVKSVTELLRTTRERQGVIRRERDQAREALKLLINRMLGELGELGSQTGRFQDSVGRYADVIEQSESLESLTGVVREMVEESRTVHSLVAQARQRMDDEHTKATDLSLRVSALEDELHRLSDEVSTDQLTQVANRRGLLRDFEVERARMQRQGGTLAIALLDVDNFKRLNDRLGHNAGDEALRSLAAVVKKSLRPSDTVARYGGEEFVVLLPDTPSNGAQQVLTRLQRNLSGGLFMHEQKNVMVTFSAGVTDYRAGERIEDALERADQALFEAKRLGKNRTCAA